MSYFGSIKQNIETAFSSTANIDASATYTSDTFETLGINGIQVYCYTDQNCTLYLDQGVDGTNWDITDELSTLASVAISRIIYSVAPYFRVRVTNNGSSATTEVRIAAGMTPVINPLPRALSDYQRLKVEGSLYDDVSDIRGKITPFGKQKVSNPQRIIGTSFSGVTKDPSFWTDAGCTDSGTVTQTGGGEVILATGETANSIAQYQSVRRARHVAGASNEFKFTGRLIDAPVADNIRRCGVYDDDNGFFFEVDGTTFGVVSRKDGVDTQVQSGSFNGDYGPSLAMGTTMGNFVIWFWEREVRFFVNGKTLHRMVASTSSLVETNTLPIRMENINENGNDTDISFEILVASVFRLGDLATAPTYKFAGTGGLSNATHILKYGAGDLHRVTVTDNTGTLLLYDGLSAAGTLIANLDASKTVGTMEFMLPFSNGLTAVVAGTPKMTIIYE